MNSNITNFFQVRVQKFLFFEFEFGQNCRVFRVRVRVRSPEFTCILMFTFLKTGYSRIFRAHQNEAMNMDSPHAYLKYHRWTDDAKGTFDCRVKTLGQKGLILYNSGWKK